MKYLRYRLYKLFSWLAEKLLYTEMASKYPINLDRINTYPKKPLTFRVFHDISGSSVIEFTAMGNTEKDEHRQELYIVAKDRNLGTELNKIITFESIK